MRIAIAQLNFHVGNFEGNLARMLEAVNRAESAGADLICFSELATCGYFPKDFLEFRDFVRRCEASVERLAEASHSVGILVGSPTVNPVLAGKDLFNSACFLYKGKLLGLQHKTLLPTYDVFDEYRYFEPADSYKVVEFKGKRIALSICEDLWNLGNENPLYTICPLDEMMPQSPDLVINLSASPFDHDQPRERMHVLKANVDRYRLPLFYINQVGAMTEVLFDGASVVMSPDGSVYDELPYFEEAFAVYDLEDVMKGGTDNRQPHAKIELIYKGIITGIRDYFGKLGLKRAIIGLSGGIDSAMAAVLAADALGAENVRGVIMPSEFSSQHSVDDAIALAQNLGIRHDILPIKVPYSSILQVLEPQFEGRPFDVTEENIQARLRAIYLMGISNKFGHILLNTTNKSEMAVGYGTLYGDLSGGLSVLGDVYKTEVYALAAYVNRNGTIVPDNTISKPPSAELRPDQKDSDSLPEYDILDPILYHYIEERLGPD